MSAVTPYVLSLLLAAKRDGEMIYVRATDHLGHPYEGRILDLMYNSSHPDAADCTIEAIDGETMYRQPVSRFEHVDVRPLRHFTGYGVAQFVDDIVNGSGWNR